MPMEEDPTVGAFYEGPDIRTFEVLAFDENDGVVQVQYDDGTVEELDLDAWYGMDLQQGELPEHGPGADGTEEENDDNDDADEDDMDDDEDSDDEENEY